MEYSHELILPNADIPFKLFVFEGSAGNYVREKHWHHSIEIFAIVEGELVFEINDQEYPLRANEFIIVNSNEVHSVKAPKQNLTIVIQIPLSMFEKYYTSERFIYFEHSRQSENFAFIQLVKEIYQNYTEKEFGYELKVQALYYLLIYMMVKHYRKSEVSPELIRQHKKLDKLTVITSYMKENYMNELSLDFMADQFGYSPTYLSRMFQKCAKINYKAFLDQIRLEHAFIDLKETDLSISELASKNGFPNEKAFSKLFREQYKMLPSEYRKRQKNAINE